MRAYATYLAAGLVMGVLDFLWLRTMDPIYRQAFGSGLVYREPIEYTLVRVRVVRGKAMVAFRQDP